MTDRVKGLMISLNKDVRVDDVEHIVDAIKMIRGVGAVETSIVDHDDWMNRSRIGQELKDKLLKAFNPDFYERAEKTTLK